MTRRRGAPLILPSLTIVGGLLVTPARAADDETSTSTTSTTAKARKFPLIAPGGLRPILKRERRQAEQTPTTTTTVAPATTLATNLPRSEPYFVATGPWPLIVFAHGYAIDAAAYAPLPEDLAAGGYVVAAPDFPGTSTAYPGGAVPCSRSRVATISRCTSTPRGSPRSRRR